MESKSGKPEVTKSKREYLTFKVKRQVGEDLLAWIEKANAKDYGTLILIEAVLAKAISLLNETHMADLQQRSMTTDERIKRAYETFTTSAPGVSETEFVDMLLNIQQKMRTTFKSKSSQPTA